MEQRYIRFTYIIPEIARRTRTRVFANCVISLLPPRSFSPLEKAFLRRYSDRVLARNRWKLPRRMRQLCERGATKRRKTYRVRDVIIPSMHVAVTLNGRQHVDSCQVAVQPSKRINTIDPERTELYIGTPGSTIDRASFLVSTVPPLESSPVDDYRPPEAHARGSCVRATSSVAQGERFFEMLGRGHGAPRRRCGVSRSRVVGRTARGKKKKKRTSKESGARTAKGRAHVRWQKPTELEWSSCLSDHARNV